MFNYHQSCENILCVCVCLPHCRSVYLTFVHLGSQWAGIYPAATNAAGRKDKAGDGAVEMART